MKQILLDLKNGNTNITDVPTPQHLKGSSLIKTSLTMISAGTERMLTDFGKAGFLEKAKQQPDKVKTVLDKIKSDGLLPTLDLTFKKLNEPLPLGYCNVGQIFEPSNKLSTEKYQRVVSNGPHAEIVSVPNNLCAVIPKNVSDEEAAFTVIGAIALQGIRLAQPTLGEYFVVFGTGLIGLIAIQLLRASGCNVLAVDINNDRLKIAESYGAKICNPTINDPITTGRAWTKDIGVDGVIITASTKSSEIIHQAAEMSRKRGRIVLVGVIGLDLRRADFYEKELSFQVSCSYGPGRYDESYELKGNDYPIGYVRWTEQRNFEAILDMMSSGRLEVRSLVTHRFPFTEAKKAYETVSNDPKALGVLLEYSDKIDQSSTISFKEGTSTPGQNCVAAMIGSGNFAKSTMAPALSKTSARLKYVSARTNGAAAAHIAKKYNFEHATTNVEEIFHDSEINTVFISTQHNSHAGLVTDALEVKKNIFVEKPLALNHDQLNDILLAYRKAQAEGSSPHLMVGYNRRFSPHIQKAKMLLTDRTEPLSMSYVCNAGNIAPDVWVHDPERGGGRIIGEACHFIDLMSFLTDSKIVSVAAAQMGGRIAIKEDKMSIVLAFEDGSIGTVNYFANGSKRYSKEKLEIYSEGRILLLDNFRRLEGFGFSGFKKLNTLKLDKGHQQQFETFVSTIQEGGAPLIPFENLMNVALATIAAVTSANEGRMIFLNSEYPELTV